MRLLLRLDGGVGAPLPLEVTTAEDATIGELADHLSELVNKPSGLTLDGFNRNDLVWSHGPRSGSTVRLAHQADSHVHETMAPVVVTVTSGPDADSRESQRLHYGSNVIGGVVLHVSDRVEVRVHGSAAPLVNGLKVLGSCRLSDGDLVTLDSGRDGTAAFVIRVTDQLRPPATQGPRIRHRMTRHFFSEFPTVDVDLPTPPDKVRLPGFPILSAVVPLLMGAGLWLATRSVASSVFIIFSFVYVVAAGFEARREARADEKFRLVQFRSDLVEVQEKIAQIHADESAARSELCPPVAAVSSIVADREGRLWERSMDGPEQKLMTVRIGSAVIMASINFHVPHGGRRDLRGELREVARDGGSTRLPLVVDLDRGGGLALVGKGEETTDIARWILVQLATLVAPDDLRVVVLCDPLRRSAWSWSSWLPHVHQTGTTRRTLIIVDGADDGDVATALSLLPAGSARLLWLSSTRAGVPERVGQIFECGDLPQIHVCGPLRASGTDDPPNSTASGQELAAVANPGAGDAAATRLPAEGLVIEDMTEDQALPLARSLASLVPSRSVLDRPSTDSGFGDAVRFGEILADADLLLSTDAVLRQWGLSAGRNRLGAPVGRAGHGVVNLDLKSDGPHALVAGTTGSGKSEFLRSLVASLALHNGPDRLTFLLIDYKGGAAFNSLDQLPHSVGIITDLSPSLAERALISLRAEIVRREKVLAALGLANLHDSPSAPLGGTDPAKTIPPSLVVIVDEFATLARELPEFVDGLVDIAQRGRSLGVHLVLATQRPAGVVTDSIRANTSLRIALRVADPDDSTDVVDTPDAAQLPRSAPGRALVRIGSSIPATVQFAYSAGPAQRPPRVSTRDLGPGPIAEQVTSGGRPVGAVASAAGRGPAGGVGATTELDLVVAITRSAAAAGDVPPPVRPWLPPLAQRVPLEPGAIGLIDRPSKQRIDPLSVDFTSWGGLLVLGASGSGRSTTLAAVGATCGMDAYLIGVRRGPFAHAGRPPWLADQIDPTDVERSLRLLRTALSRIATQTSDSSVHRQLILVDDYATFEEAHERVNRGEALDLLHRLAREGRSSGVHLAVSAQRRIEVPSSLAASLGMQIVLRCPSEDEASILGLDANAASPEVPPGRGYVAGEVVQIALAQLGADAAEPTTTSHLRGATIGTLPENLPFAELKDSLQNVAPDKVALAGSSPALESLPIGTSGDDLSPVFVNLKHSHLVIAGPRRSGRTTALRLLAASLHHTASLHQVGPGPAQPTMRSAAYLLTTRSASASSLWMAELAVSPSGAVVPTESSGEGEAPDDLGSFFEAVATSASSGIPTLLAIDDLPEMLDTPHEIDIETGLNGLLTIAEQAPLRLVLSGEIEAMSRCYASALGRVRSGRSAILIQPDPDVHGSIAHCELPRRDELQPAPGRGWLVQDGRPTPVQLAHP